MCGADDFVALDFPGVCGAAFLVRESALGETDFAGCGVDYVSPAVWLDYLLMRNKHAHILASAVYFIGKK